MKNVSKTDYLIICLIVISLGLLIGNTRVKAVERIYNRDSDLQVNNPLANDVLVNKTFYLNRDFTPYDLIKPDVNHLIPGDINRNKLRFEVALMLENLIYKAELDNIYLYSVSSYRSYQRQEEIFLANALDRGFEKANMTSALPGESEHQTGLAVDLTSAAAAFRLSTEFGETEEGKWLAENAHYFGFIIRYPEDETHTTGYSYEPWHLRYLGVEDAVKIVESGMTYEEYYFQHKISPFNNFSFNDNQQYRGLYEEIITRDDWYYKAEEEKEELKEEKIEEAKKTELEEKEAIDDEKEITEEPQEEKELEQEDDGQKKEDDEQEDEKENEIRISF